MGTQVQYTASLVTELDLFDPGVPRQELETLKNSLAKLELGKYPVLLLLLHQYV